MKRAIITGASDGLGLELAKLLAAQGTEVIALSRTAPAAPCIHIETDLRDESSVERAIERIRQDFASFDCLVNCAGVLAVVPLEKLDYKATDDLFRVNVIAPMRLAAGLLDDIKRNCADIVNVGSSISFKAYREQCAYGASKWALRGMTENLQLELASSPCRVIGFYPGGFKSRLFEKATANPVDLGKFMEPEELAKFILQLLSLPKNMEVSQVLVNRKTLARP